MRSVLSSIASIATLFASSLALAQTASPPAPPPQALTPSQGAPVAAAPSAPASLVPPPAAVAPSAPPLPVPAASDTHLDLSTLRALRDKEVLTQAEYDAALRDLNDTTGATVAGDAPTFVLGKFSTTFYGMVKTDFLYDSTESFTDLAGNTQVARPAGSPVAPPPLPLPSSTPATTAQNYAGQHPQFQVSPHDSRFGFYVRAPETSGGVRLSGLLEFDLFGLGTTTEPSTTGQTQYFTSSVPRLRHAYFRVETPVLDFLVGQYWHLFGWQNVYHPASVQAQGLVGELYSRDVQVRLSKAIRTAGTTTEIAIAALRPPESGSAVPQLEAGLRFSVEKWRGAMTNGASGTATQPASIGVSGNYRYFVLPELSLVPKDTVNLATGSVAGDLFLPIVPVRHGKKDNALSVHGEVVYGNGISDLYTGLTGGVTFPYLTNVNLGLNPAPVYTANIDNGMVAFDLRGDLRAIEWTAYLAGLQYYLPVDNGRVFVVANYAHMESDNTAQFAANYNDSSPSPGTNHQNSATSSTRKSIDFYDASLFVDAMTGVRIGVEGAYYQDHYVDGVQANNIRVDLAGMFLF